MREHGGVFASAFAAGNVQQLGQQSRAPRCVHDQIRLAGKKITERGERFGGRDHFRNRGFGAFGWGYDSDYYDYPGYYGDYGAYGYSQPYASQYWYYCQYPAGYYPYVSQCSTNWQPVPAG